MVQVTFAAQPAATMLMSEVKRTVKQPPGAVDVIDPGLVVPLNEPI